MTEKGHKVLNIILAFIVSVSGWTYVVYNNDPMTDVKYKDVPITFIGESTLANRGLGISKVSAEMLDVTLNQRRISTNDISSDNITVTADVSEAEAGENSIVLRISGPESTTVLDSDIKAITVDVEETDSKELKIDVVYDEMAETETEPIVTAMTSTRATVIGAESQINKVKSVTSVLNFNAVSEIDRNFTGILRARDKDGNEIPHVVIYPNEVNFNAHSGIMKTVKLNVNAVDRDDFYKREMSAPETVTIKGLPSDLEGITSIETEEIFIGQYYEDAELDIDYILPEGVYLASASEDATIKLKVRLQSEEELQGDKDKTQAKDEDG